MKKNVFIALVCVLCQFWAGAQLKAMNVATSVADGPGYVQVHETEQSEIIERFVAKVENAGQLETVLGDKINCIDTLVVEGTLDAADFDALWKATYYGNTTVIDIVGADCSGKIPDCAFYKQDIQVDENEKFTSIKLRSIVLGDDITEIGESAFRSARKLERVNIPEHLRLIGQYAFSACSSLNVPLFVFPEGIEIQLGAFLRSGLIGKAVFGDVKLIGDDCFYGTRLLDVVFNGTVDKIGFEAFRDCEFTYADFSNVEELSASVLNGAKECTKIVLNDNLTTIPFYFARCCSALEECNIPQKCERIESDAFYLCENLKNVEFPEGLRAIDYSAFAECQSLKMLQFPASLENLGQWAFSGCSGVVLLSCRAMTPPVCGKDVFDGVAEDTPLLVPEGTAELYRNAPGWNRFRIILETGDFPSSVDEVFASDADFRIRGGIGEIRIAGSNSAFCEVYAVDGRKVTQARIADGAATIEVKAGIYLVRLGGKVAKVQVK